ncbi:RecQ familyATP-dependent DNA helicase [Nitzschia inconspicua]|uniref:DNA 3'-5' helicase n=1 Tax=Nitzschia inconspicua TaxID=303405 RepID=A0A9K3KPB9_9STRA|nr:RecQ familyATP-dependent DNA helicase [Nitzschia inconspicua]
MDGNNGSVDNPRKRRLLLSSRRASAAAPPPPASVARLESLLLNDTDDDPKVRSKKATTVRKNDGPPAKKVKPTTAIRSKAILSSIQPKTHVPSFGRLSNITTSRPSTETGVFSVINHPRLTIKSKSIKRRLEEVQSKGLAMRSINRENNGNHKDVESRKAETSVPLRSSIAAKQPSKQADMTTETNCLNVLPTGLPPSKSDKASTLSIARTLKASSKSKTLGLNLSKAKTMRRSVQRQAYASVPLQDVTPSSPTTSPSNVEVVVTRKPSAGLSKPTNDTNTNATIPKPIDKHISGGSKGSRSNIVNNDNFVRLNLKNNAGACRGSRNKSKKFQRRRFSSNRQQKYQDLDHRFQRNETQHEFQFKNNFNRDHDDDDNEDSEPEWEAATNPGSSSHSSAYVSKMTGIDPMDEFLDGTFHSNDNTDRKASSPHKDIAVPKCSRHQRPCKLAVVRKNTTGNKGRTFFVCSMPRGEQCNHFQWADDTVEAAKDVLSKNKLHSSFISRQVAAHVDRFRTFTVPELKKEAARRNLNTTGKKQQLLMRLAIWTRDEIVKGSPHLEEDFGNVDTNPTADSDNVNGFLCLESSDSEEESDDDGRSCSSAGSELELLLDDDNKDARRIQVDDRNSRVNNKVQEDSNSESLLTSLQRIFGHNSFRDGQEWAIKRCLEGKKSLLVAPTGFGKSLCYALPAALQDGICIVVSPLISLIQDQLRALPPRVPAATLSGSLSSSMTAAILDDVVRKRLKILFVSPERLTSPAFRRLFIPTWNDDTKAKERKFPEISLLCIDEAHCISQWAHNFRPCFLRFKSLVSVMKPKSVLAITATAGPRVVKDIIETLEIPTIISSNDDIPKDKHDSIKIIGAGRDNIDVKVKFMENQEDRLSTLADILTPRDSKAGKNGEYDGMLSRGSVIVYVWRQKDTEVVAEYLNGASVSGGVVIYHGGMDAKARAKSQSSFMRGKARVCVATIAFGLGIDKADIEGVIHLYLSNSPEHYLQEIGRAGRDGRRALAIALPLLEEVPVRHSLSHSNLVSKIQIQTLLRRVKRVVEATTDQTDTKLVETNRSLHVALPVKALCLECDCKQETLETFLSLIETMGGPSPLLHVEGLNYDNAAIAMKRRSLQKLAETEQVALSILTVSQCIDPPLLENHDGAASTYSSSFQRQFLAYSMGSYSFSIASVANHLGASAEPRNVFAALRRLQASNELELSLDTSDAGRIFHLKVTKAGCQTFGNEDQYRLVEKHLTDEIHQAFFSSTSSSAEKVLDMHYILNEVASVSLPAFEEEGSKSDKSASLVRFQDLTSKFLSDRLQRKKSGEQHEILPKSFYEIRKEELQTDIYVVLQDLPQVMASKEIDPATDPLLVGKIPEYTALAIAKFLHGMESPRTPFLLCRHHPVFGKWRHVDFSLIVDAISNALKNFLDH